LRLHPGGDFGIVDVLQRTVWIIDDGAEKCLGNIRGRKYGKGLGDCHGGCERDQYGDGTEKCSQVKHLKAAAHALDALDRVRNRSF
jgi:hypothetical protein